MAARFHRVVSAEMQTQRVKRKPRPPRVDSSSGWTLRYALGAYLVSLAVGAALAGALTGGELRLGLGVLGVDAAMLACLLPLHRSRRLSARDLGLRRSPPAEAVGLVVVSVIAIGILDVAWSHAAPRLPVTPLLATLHESVAAEVLGAFAAGICAPVVEEIFFRGLLYRTLRNRMSVARAALLAGVMFGAVHATTYPLSTLPPKMAFGVVACLLYESTGSLYPGIALHSLIDASAFEVAISGHNRIVLPAFALLGVVLLVYAGVRRVRSARASGSISRSSLRQWLLLTLAVAFSAIAMFMVAVAVSIALEGGAHTHVAAMVVAVIFVLACAAFAAWLARRSWRGMRAPGDPSRADSPPGAQQAGEGARI